ncbi:MAG: polyprenyl synthetase family protein, partial [Pyrinomonadaceae bacterium]
MATESSRLIDIWHELNERVDRQLDQLVPSQTVEPFSVHKAIRWSLFGGGKRLRPVLTILTGRIFGATDESLMSTACAFEMMHAYSLIHDDLPSMDNDDLRRGRPTCHIQFGEATAILAGDALQTLAFQAIAADEKLDTGLRLRLITELIMAAGTPDGMVAGQAFDLEAETGASAISQPEDIHRLKTGSMIIAAARCGAILGGASDSELEHITGYGEQLGL